MILYFSGTGNSKHAASVVADAQGEALLSIPEELDKASSRLSYKINDGEMVGFVYPVHAWGPPRLVLDLIKRLEIVGNPFVFSLCTCGDEEGQTTKVLNKALIKKGLRLDSAFSLRMPNNYIAGFDIDPQEQIDAKITAADERLVQINATLAKRQSGVFDLLPGSSPGLKSVLINPLFNRFAMGTGKFFATDACNGCGLCEQICPVHTIKVDSKPSWGPACTQCLACIHHCPEKAIQYGPGTAGKGRYVYPE